MNSFIRTTSLWSCPHAQDKQGSIHYLKGIFQPHNDLSSKKHLKNSILRPPTKNFWIFGVMCVFSHQKSISIKGFDIYRGCSWLFHVVPGWRASCAEGTTLEETLGLHCVVEGPPEGTLDQLFVLHHDGVCNDRGRLCRYLCVSLGWLVSCSFDPATVGFLHRHGLRIHCAGLWILIVVGARIPVARVGKDMLQGW